MIKILDLVYNCLMKKLIILFLLFIICNCSFAADNLSFIYINGSNNNDKKMKNWYETGVRRLHPVLKKKFLKNKDIKKYYSQIGGLNIKDEPVIFFWGDKSKADLDFVKEQLSLSRAISSSGAYIARNLLTKYMHDAIWVQKTHNMLPILDELNDVVKKEANEGNEVILYGYSAGTFVTYEYLFNKLPYINLEKLFESLSADNDILDFVKANPMNDTCVSALSYQYSGIGTVSSAGHLILNQNKNELKQNYLKLNEMTQKACIPHGKVRGVVNFASPLVLFYSDLSDANYEPTFYNKLMIKYVMENGISLITVNFREDPIGFPSNHNLTVPEIEYALNLPIKNPTGVIYDYSGAWSKRPFVFAHTSYWSAKGTFANAIVKGFVNGYKFQYDPIYQQKVIKRNSKRSEL